MISLFICNSCSIYVSHVSIIFQQLLYYQSHVRKYCMDWLSISAFIGPVRVCVCF